jgi:fatty acid desaturase
MISTNRINHRDFIASLSMDQRKRLSRKTDFPGLQNIAVHFGLIIIIGWLILAQIPYWPLLMILQGILLIFLFTLLHETIHRTAFRTKWINIVVARICGFILLLPTEWFRYFHLEHHRHTQDSTRDPELNVPKPKTRWQYVIHISGLPVWLSQLRVFLKNAFRQCEDSFVPKPKHRRIRTEALLMLVCYFLTIGISIFLNLYALLYIWILPLFLGQPFLRLYLLAEHAGCPHSTNMFENSRTTFTNFFIRKLAWNMSFHAEHHIYPAVPFHQLPELHELTRPNLQETENGYLRFNIKYLLSLKD